MNSPNTNSNNEKKKTKTFTPEDSNDQAEADFAFYSQFDQIHGKELRKEWYDQATAAYIATRPRYPIDMMRQALQDAGLLWSSNSEDGNDHELNGKHHILEVGCGPGTATVSLVKMGYQVTAMDPSPQNCIAARQQCQEALLKMGVADEATITAVAEKRVTVVESTFEDFDESMLLSKPSVSAILCPTSFHWISPDVACTKTAAILRRTNGCLLLWWAMPPMPSMEVCQQLQDIFDVLAVSKLGLDMQRYGTKNFSQQNLEHLHQRIRDSGLYHDNNGKPPLELQSASYRYSPAKFVTLLSTLSPYIALDEEKRLTLLERLGDRLQEICEKQHQIDLELTGYFGFSCFWVKADDDDDDDDNE